MSIFGGVPEEFDNFEIDIIGWRREGERGDKTPVYTVALNIAGREPPVILSQPIGGKFEIGTDVALTVASERSSLRYLWSQDGQEIPSTIRYLVDVDSQCRVLVPQGAIDDTWRAPSISTIAAGLPGQVALVMKVAQPVPMTPFSTSMSSQTPCMGTPRHSFVSCLNWQSPSLRTQIVLNYDSSMMMVMQPS